MCALLLGTGTQAAAASRHKAAPHAADEWTLTQRLEDTASREFYDVAATSATDVWQVGDKAGGSGTTGGGAIQHWDGRKWTEVPPAGGSKASSFSNVAARTANDAWVAGTTANATAAMRRLAGRHRFPRGLTAAGTTGTRAAGTPLAVQHWDGKAWHRVPRPALPEGWESYSNGLAAFTANSVWMSSDDVHVGSPESKSHLERWDGKAWHEIALPALPTGGQADPGTITGTGPNDIWVAINGDKNGVLTPYLAHWDGKHWTLTRIPVPSAYPQGWVLVNGNTIVENPHSLYVFGETNSDPNAEPTAHMFAHWDGKSWKQLKTPPLYSVNASGRDGSGNLWVGGWKKGAAGTSMLAKWTGTDWKTYPLPAGASSQGTQNSILSFTPVGNGAFMCGLASNDDVTKHWGLSAAHA